MFLKTTAALVAVLGAAAALPYACAPIYRFPEPVPFAGAALLNPYSAAEAGRWQRANLHAHGRAWIGLTNGRLQSDEEIVRAYRSFGYSVPGVSDYHHIAAFDGVATLPIYEHGYNIGKRHQLAIGARDVAWLDFPLGQTLSHQQFIIDRVSETADLVALAHPFTRDGYTADNLAHLTRYHLIEVINGPFRHDESWDAALSAGRMVWGIGNDDTHDLGDPKRTAMAWTMINAPTAGLHDIVEALRAGRSYAVSRTNEIASAVETTLDRVTVEDGTLRVTTIGDPSTFVFVGQNGAVRKTVKGTTAASYVFDGQDTYIRTIVRSPRTTMLLNPVLRTHGGPAHVPAASVNLVGTWVFRAVLLLTSVALLLIYRERRRPLRASRPRAVLTQADRETA